MKLPRENPNLIGHEAIEQSFLDEFARGKMHHAYLLCGPKGIGKATFAYRLARFLLSHGAINKPADDTFSLFGDAPKEAAAPLTGLEMAEDNPIFRRVIAGSHSDLLAIAPLYDEKKKVEKAEINADQAKEVPQFLSLTPAESEWRVVIVDAVDQLNTTAANALLKILEEPPARSILLLVCHTLGDILPTIKSRCRVMRMSAPDLKHFSKILNQIAPDVTSEAHEGLYAMSQGSPGLAIQLNDKNATEIYRGLLSHMQPDVTPAEKAQFASKLAGSKSPDTLKIIYHCWQIAIDRIAMFPHLNHVYQILEDEEPLLKDIAQNMEPKTRYAWRESARKLWNQTDTFHLDRARTIELMLDPARLPLAVAA
ncbi:MAG: DNA polymerase III subunit delta' [Alphaproteobacteria bacterium]|nr:DNA polymerase III subunit delta' [Alphaproteobacteria bacterium]